MKVFLWKFKFAKIAIFLLIVLIVIVAGFFVGKIFFSEKKQKEELKKERPNLILISMDCVRADHVSSYGYPRETTPNIDNLAKEGIIFKNYITNSYLTPISEMSLHAGMYPSSSGFVGFNTVLPEKTLTLAQILKIYNYRTAAFGNSPEFSVFPTIKQSFNRGFDIYNFENEFGGKKITRSRDQFVDTNEILNFITEKDSPFFAWIALGSAHFPYNKFPQKFGDGSYSGPLKNFYLDWGSGDILPFVFDRKIYQSNRKDLVPKENLDEKDIQYIVDRYDDGVFATDEWIGRFLEEFNKTEAKNDTIIILTSEHGEEFGEHGYIHHYDVFDSTIRPPLIIKSLFSQGNRIINNQVRGVDILPTVLDFLNIPKANQIEGGSLNSLISGLVPEDFNRYVFSERIPLWERPMFQAYSMKSGGNDRALTATIQHFNSTTEKLINVYPEDGIRIIKDDDFLFMGDIAVRTNDWKLIYRKTKYFQEKYSWWRVLSKNEEKMQEYELYNLKDDQHETKNIIGEYPAIADELKIQLNMFIKKMEKNKIDIQTEELMQEYF